jgi:hypothetical protein
VTVAELRATVIQSAKIDLDLAADNLLLYKKDPFSDFPATAPLYALTESPFKPGATRVYYRLVRGVLPAVLKTSILVLAQVSLDCRTVTASEDFVLRRGSTLSSLFERITDRGLIAAPFEAVAAAVVRAGKFVGQLSATAGLADGTVVRFDVPGPLADGEALLPVVPAAVGPTGWLVAAGEPFRVRIPPGATVADVKEEVLAGVGADARKRARFFLGGEWVRFAPKAVIADSAEITDVARSCLYFVTDPRAPAGARGRHEPVRIDN